MGCILCNLTRRVQAEPILREIFDRWPDATSLASADEEELRSLIKPLGLSSRRAKILIRFSSAFSEGGWTDVTDLPGIGKYASDSYRIFCLGDWRSVEPRDHALNWYHTWLKQTTAD